MFKRRNILAGALGLPVAMSALAAPALARDKTRWRMSNMYPRGVSFGVAYEAFARRIEQATDGRLVIEMVYDGEGIGAAEIFSGVKSGLIEMGSPYMALHTGEMPSGVVQLGLPGGPERFDQLYTLLEHGGWKEILVEAYASHGLAYIGSIMQPGVYVITKKPIQSLVDLNGLKLRAPGVYGAYLRAFGVAPVTMAFTEGYTSLATGVIDGAASSNLIDYRDGKWYEQAQNIYSSPLSGAQVSPIIVHKAAYDGLPADIQLILRQVQVSHCFDHVAISMLDVAAARAEMESGGAVFSAPPSPQDRLAMQTATEAIWEQYAGADDFSSRLIEAQRRFQAKIS